LRIGGDILDTSMQEIIKSIIQIDKTADEMNQKFEIDLKQKKQELNKEIERLREEIVEGEIKRLKKIKEEEISRTISEAEKIREAALVRSKEMYELYLTQKEDLTQHIFNNILG
jgi:hypothetical protein